MTLSRQLSWSHILVLLPLKNAKSKLFYAEKTITESWSVRELRKSIETKSFERTAIADLQLHHPDLLFYHRSLKRLVAIELKIGKFQEKIASGHCGNKRKI